MGGKVGFFDEATEIIQEEAGQAAQTVKQQVTGKSGSQVQNTQGQKLPQVPQQQPPAGHASAMPPETPGTNQPQDDSAQKFVKDLYGVGTPSMSEGEIKEEELEDKKKEEELKQQLHSQYYQGLVNRPKQQEERQGEKIEREEEEKKMEEQEEVEKKQKDELPVVVTKDMGTKEKLRGVSG